MTNTKLFDAIFTIAEDIARELGYVHEDGFDGASFTGADKVAVLQIEDVVNGQFRVVVAELSALAEDDEPDLVWERRFTSESGMVTGGVVSALFEARDIARS